MNPEGTVIIAMHKAHFLHDSHCHFSVGLLADLYGDDLVILVDAHPKLCCEQVSVLIPGGVCSACGQACVGCDIAILPVARHT